MAFMEFYSMKQTRYKGCDTKNTLSNVDLFYIHVYDSIIKDANGLLQQLFDWIWIAVLKKKYKHSRRIPYSWDNVFFFIYA